jgi:HAAS
MTDAALDHPLVRAYLRELDNALAPLPPARGAELRDQIAAHFDEELPPGASDDEVADAIRRLGPPAGIAREAGARPQRILSPILRRRSRKFWFISAGFAMAVVSAGVLISLLISVETAPALIVGSSIGFWYPQDEQHAVATQEIPGQDSVVVPVRWRQQQGFYLQIHNRSRYTQTVPGYAQDASMSPDDPLIAVGQNSPGNVNHARLSLSAGKSVRGYPGEAQVQRYQLPVSIPPGQSRYLRVLWTNRVCIQKGSSGALSALTLRVRVGWVARTEAIDLDPTVGIQAQTACWSQ